MKKFQNPFLLSYIQSKIENRKTKMNIPMVTPKINIFTDTWLYCIKLKERTLATWWNKQSKEERKKDSRELHVSKREEEASKSNRCLERRRNW